MVLSSKFHSVGVWPTSYSFFVIRLWMLVGFIRHNVLLLKYLSGLIFCFILVRPSFLALFDSFVCVHVYVFVGVRVCVRWYMFGVR